MRRGRFDDYIAVAALGQTLRAGDDGFGIDHANGQHLFDGALHVRDRMLGQKLQDTDELPGSGAGTMALFEPLAQVGEHGGKPPIAIDRSVVQRRRPPAQRYQVMQRIEDQLPAFVAAPMLSDRGPVEHKHHAVDVTLDGDRLEGEATGHAVAVGVEGDGLVLVHLGGLVDARIERALWQRECSCLVLPEALADGLALLGHCALHLIHATLQ